ncbi:MAG: YihY/virulence factor BrkB family protein [Blastocatellia bacterium]|nr:YihY/virulence factor BrkB family protein [Blastocatellia bacterium]
MSTAFGHLSRWKIFTSYSFETIKQTFNPHFLLPRLRSVLSQTFASFMENDLTSSAAALSYFTLLALFPLLFLVLNIGTTVFGTEQLRAFLVERILELLPGTRGFVLKNVEAVTAGSTGLILSCLTLVAWAGSWMFRVIEKAFSRIWNTGCRPFIQARLLNLFVTIVVAFVLIIASVITSFVALLRSSAERLPMSTLPEVTVFTGFFWHFLFAVLSLFLTIELFTIIYRFLPNTRVTWREAMPGAIVAGILWELAKYGFSRLLPYFHYDLVYGSIGAGVALMSWVYISSLIMMFGAQLSGVLYCEDLTQERWDRAAEKAMKL